MRPIYSVVFSVWMALTAFLVGYRTYSDTRVRLKADLNAALAQTLAERGHLLASPDTLQACRQLARRTGREMVVRVSGDCVRRHLKHDLLRGKAYLAYALTEAELDKEKRWGEEDALHSDTFCVRVAEGETLAFRSYAQVSVASIIGQSDWWLAALPLFLSLLSMGAQRSGFMVAKQAERAGAGTAVYGGLAYDEKSRRFVDEQGQAVPFTPMQQQLMELFHRSEGHCLTHREICEALWPKKENADETLYTLVRRLKAVLRSRSRLTIASERGRGYVLMPDNQQCQEDVRK